MSSLTYVRALHRNTGHWALCSGLRSPTVLVDPTCSGSSGFNSLVYHELRHCRERHALKSLIWLAVPVVGLALWCLARRRYEADADGWALHMWGEKDFFAFVKMTPHPQTRWGRWLYGADALARTQRAIRHARKM